jgi:outer membrane cobalamin receptor
MKVLLAMTLVGATVLAGAANLCAATDDDGVYRLGEVVVSGEQSVVEAVGTTHKVSAEEIEKRGVRSLNEALNLLPGVNVRVGGDGAPRIDMRGFRTRHIKLLLNGTPFNSTYDGQFDPALISVENIAEIVVTTGATSTLYGSGGNAGVINIITKKGTKGGRGSLGGELGSWDTNLLRGTASYGADKYDVFVSGSVYEQDHFEVSDHFSPAQYEDGDERDNSDRRRNNVFVNVGVSPTDKTHIGATISYLTGDRGKPASVLLDDFTSKKLKFEREDDVEEFNAQLALNHDFDGPFSVKGWAYFNSLEMVETEYKDETYADIKSRLDSKVEISGVNLQLAYDLQNLGKATLGLMAENDDWEATEKTSDVSEDKDFQLYSVDFEYEVNPLDKLGAVLGAGYHWQDRSEKDEEDYSYLIGLYYDLFDGTRLRASHARKVRFPTLRDLYSSDGNVDLGCEVTWHYEAGVEQDLPAATTLSVTGFYIDVEDFIAKDDSVKPKIRKNFEEYEFKGVEVVVENRYFDKLLLRAGYTYLDTEDKSSGSLVDEIQNNPKHKTTLEATYQLPWNMSVYGSAMWVANAYTYNGDNTVQKRLPEYLICDFRINKSAADGALDLYFGINNLFDADYVQSYGLPQPGRFMYGGVTWKF